MALQLLISLQTYVQDTVRAHIFFRAIVGRSPGQRFYLMGMRRGVHTGVVDTPRGSGVTRTCRYEGGTITGQNGDLVSNPASIYYLNPASI